MKVEVADDKLIKIKVDVNSSILNSMEYNLEDFTLVVKYKGARLFNKRVKRYNNVTPHQFFDLLSSKSVGKALLRLLHTLRAERNLSAF